MFKLWLRIATVFFSFAAFSSPSWAGTEKFYENSSSGNALLNLIHNTKKSLDIEIYEMDDPSVHESLRAALNRGVKVRVIQEPKPVGNSCNLFESKTSNDPATCLENRKLVADIRSRGGVYVPFNTRELCAEKSTHCFEHGKIVISDEKYVLLSTGNFNATNLCNKKENPKNCNRDYSVLTWDAGSVRSFQSIFNHDLAGQAYDLASILTSSDAHKITVSPYSAQPLVQFIRSAKKIIQVENQYLKEPVLNRALMEAAQRGVKVYIMVSSLCSFARPAPSAVNKWTQVFTQYDQAGIQSRIFTRQITINGVLGYLHAKAILVDGARAWVGSVNGSTMSLSNNREFGIFIDDPTEALKLGAFLKSDFLEPNSETWKESVECKKDFIVAEGDSSGGDQANGFVE